MTYSKNTFICCLASFSALCLAFVTSFALATTEVADSSQKKAYVLESLETYELEKEKTTPIQLDNLNQASFPTSFNPLWSTKLVRPSEHVGSGPELVSHNGSLYFMSLDRCLAKLERKSGKLIWGTCLSRDWEEIDAEFGGFTIEDNYSYVASSTGYLAKIDNRDGLPVWQRRVNLSLRGAPAVKDNLIIVRSADNRTLAFFSDTGHLAWIHRTGQRRFGLLDNLKPLVYDETLIITHASGFMQQTITKNGTLLWQIDLFEETPFGFALREQLRDIKVNPLIEDNIAYVAAYSDQTTAVDLDRGAILWRTAISSVTPPASSGNALFIIDTFNNLVAVNKENGKLFWSKSIDQAIKFAAVASESELKVDKAFYNNYIDLKGNPFWLKMLVLKDQLVIISDGGIYLIFNPLDGTLLGYGSLGSTILSGPLLIDGVLYLIDYDDHLVAIGAELE